MPFTRKAYEPLPGSIPYRAIEYLAQLPKDHLGLHTAELAEAIGHESNTLAQLLRPARQAGMLHATPNVMLNGAPMRWRFVSRTPVQPPPAAAPAADDDTDRSVAEERQIIRPAADAPLPEGVAARPPWPFPHNGEHIVTDEEATAAIEKLRGAPPLAADPPAEPGPPVDLKAQGTDPTQVGMDLAEPGADKTVVATGRPKDEAFVKVFSAAFADVELTGTGWIEWKTGPDGQNAYHLRQEPIDFKAWLNEARKPLSHRPIAAAQALTSHSKRLEFDVLVSSYRDQQAKPLRTAIWDDGSVHLVRGDTVIAELTREEALALRARLFAITGAGRT